MKNTINFSPTLYIGEHQNGLYALPAFVDQNTVTISTLNSGPLLLEGPDFIADPTKYRNIPLPGLNVRIDNNIDAYMFQSLEKNFASFIVLGYYNVPEYSTSRLQISGKVMDFLPIAPENVEEKKTENKNKFVSYYLKLHKNLLLFIFVCFDFRILFTACLLLYKQMKRFMMLRMILKIQRLY